MFKYKKTIALISALVLFLTTSLLAQPPTLPPQETPQIQQIKIGYVDTERLKQEYKEFAETQEKFGKELALYRAQADSIQQEIMSLQEDLQKKATVLSDAGKKEMQKKILDKQATLSKLLGPEGAAAMREKELSQPLIEKIDAVIRLIALKEGYTFVFDSAGGLILYAKDGYDLTERVLEELNKK